VKWLAALTLALAASATMAQSTPSPAATTWQNSVSWFQKTWKQVEKQGRPAAERIVRQAPAQFKAVQANLAGLTEKVAAVAQPKDLDQKKALLLEFWRLRHCVSIMSMLTPANLEMLTGIDQKELAAMQTELGRIQKLLQR
jgi:Skp family chaperone for outer membrane proteins